MTIATLPAPRVQVVDSLAELTRVRWFQLERYFAAGLIDVLPDVLPDDVLVEQSVYFAAYSPLGDIWGTCRLIGTDLEHLPIFRDHVIDPQYLDPILAEPGQVAEVSRMAVSTAAPQLQTVAALGREMWRHCARHQSHTIWLGSIGLPMMRLFERGLGLPFEIMGPVLHDYYNEDSYPVLIDMVRFLYERIGSRRWRFFTEDLVIDLTSMREPIIVESALPDLGALRAS
jgi:hypothetical protein